MAFFDYIRWHEIDGIAQWPQQQFPVQRGAMETASKQWIV
jgi:hypothetical protein